MTTPSRLAIVLGRWGPPPDDVAWAILAVGLGIVLATLAGRDVVENVRRASRARFLGGAGLLAAFLTLGYAAHYLRGGPRIIDATMYVLQAKALAHGHVTWPVPFPSASFRGRFLVDLHDRLAGIFPPGWPLLLSAGFLVGSPMLVGIALAAGLAIASYALAFQMTRDEAVARLAAALSVVCGVLRYHTADPMSHAASALAVTVALACVMRPEAFGDGRKPSSSGAWGRSPHPRRTRAYVIAGLCIGYVAATRPVSAAPIALVCLWLVRRAPARQILTMLLSTLPGVIVLLLACHAVTGSFFESPQHAYYALADGPPGCFRYGFGSGIGCLHEHGDFVRARLEHGFGLSAALGTTLRRIHTHLSDALGGWPVLLLVLPACVQRVRRDALVRAGWALVLLQILVYAPFYFDGDYPGAGARFYADVIGVEHALVAVSLASFVPSLLFDRKATVLVGLVIVCFALHGAYDGLALAERDGGRPMFEPERLQDAHVESGLLFMDTDHGFDLAYDPFVTDPKRGLVVARQRNDNHDRLLFEQLGKPTSWLYHFSAMGKEEPSVVPYTPPEAMLAGRELWRFEAEADWPPLAQEGAWAEPIFATTARQNCPSNGAALRVHGPGTVTLALPVPKRGKWMIRPYALVFDGDSLMQVRLHAPAGDLEWSSSGIVKGTPACVELGTQSVELEAGELPLEIDVPAGVAALDRIELLPH